MITNQLEKRYCYPLKCSLLTFFLSFFLKINLFILIGGLLLYHIVVVCAIHWHKSSPLPPPLLKSFIVSVPDQFAVFFNISLQFFKQRSGLAVKNLPAMQETQETWVWPFGWEYIQEKEMATHSSILAGRIPWTKEAGGLQSVGLQRFEHHWATKHAQALFVNQGCSNVSNRYARSLSCF